MYKCEFERPGVSQSWILEEHEKTSFEKGTSIFFCLAIHCLLFPTLREEEMLLLVHL